MKIIRQSSWETNSSSMHSLVLFENNVIYDTIELGKDGIITVVAQEMDCIDDQRVFQNGRNSDTSPVIKLKYLFSYVMTQLQDYQYCDFPSQLSKQKDEAIQFRKSLIRQTVIQHTGASDVVFVGQCKLPSMSIGGTEKNLDYILESKQRIKQFVFGRKSGITVVLGN